jgi:vacuolar-type H+-ATPase subunit H
MTHAPANGNPLAAIRDAERDRAKKLAEARRQGRAEVERAQAEAARMIAAAVERGRARAGALAEAAYAQAEQDAERTVREAQQRAATLTGPLPGADAAVEAMLALIAGAEEVD